ncbi:conserved hypothetical protein [Ricinus communis]|uniref:Uncharacterized protein n=1 Tax=Ricinus communis TaxID=3988 RepID=B9SD52_RICCO|nr:conserved hypothetical protein [Ricinus communis]
MEVSNVTNDNRDYPRCCDCYWLTKPGGPCLKSGSGQYDNCFEWDKNPLEQ